MSSLVQDFRHALRALTRNPGFTAVVVLTLALGIGGTAAVFAALRASLLTQPPYPDIDRIVAPDLFQTNGTASMEQWSYPKYQILRANMTTLELMTARRGLDVVLTGGTEPERVNQEATTAEYFTLFGVRAALGRLLLPSDDTPGAAPVAVLQEQLWRRQFGGDPAVIGKTVRINGTPVEIVGVADPEFRGLSG